MVAATHDRHMNISDIRGYAVSSPIDPHQERPFFGGVRRLLKRDVVLIVVETRDGERGYATAGASSSAMREYFEGESQGTFADIIEGPVADAIEGETVERPAEVHDTVDAIDLPERIRTEAASALDVALFDIRGKEIGAPIYELLAEDTTPSVEIPLYASAGMYMQPAGYVEQAKQIESLGFMGYKYRPGIGPAGDRETVEQLVERTDEIEIMLDVHTWWKLGESYGRDTIRELIEHADEHGAFWIEEPVEPADKSGYVELSATGAPLAGGESEASPDGLVELGNTGALDYLQGDVRHHRGYTGCQTAIEFCNDRGIEFVPHNFGTWLGLIANAHLVAAAPDVRLLEYPVFEQDPVLDSTKDPGMYPFDLAFDILDGQPAVENGQLTVPDGPGLGVDVNLDVIEDYPFIKGPWTEFQYEN